MSEMTVALSRRKHSLILYPVVACLLVVFYGIVAGRYFFCIGLLQIPDIYEQGVSRRPIAMASEVKELMDMISKIESVKAGSEGEIIIDSSEIVQGTSMIKVTSRGHTPAEARRSLDLLLARVVSTYDFRRDNLIALQKGMLSQLEERSRQYEAMLKSVGSGPASKGDAGLRLFFVDGKLNDVMLERKMYMFSIAMNEKSKFEYLAEAEVRSSPVRKIALGLVLGFMVFLARFYFLELRPPAGA